MDLEYFLRPSRWVFYAHSAFWMAFLVARMRVLAEARAGEAPTDGVRHDNGPVQARFAGLLVRLHVVALVGLYPALWIATTLDPLAPHPAAGVAGVALLLVGAGVASWAIAVFRSYKLRATLVAGHELCTDGPFRYVRHPLYLAFGLLGLGSAIWANTPVCWAFAVALWVIADLRARTEERLLADTFGQAYREYLGSTKRLLPFVY